MYYTSYPEIGGSTILVIMLLFLLTIAIAYASAKEFQEIAKAKGHWDKKYFWWCLFCGIIGWLMVVALPDRSAKASSQPVYNQTAPKQAEPSDQLPKL